jgi:hypothetical protein
MRTITVSTDVFARIWASRNPGEESEDAILDRLVPGKSSAPSTSAALNSPPNSGGHTERRYGVHFPAGFEVSRIYLGREYHANAVSAGWALANDGKTYASLNELSKGIGAKVENAWQNWFYFEGSERKPIAALRDPNKITRRSNRVIDTDKLLAESDALPAVSK